MKEADIFENWMNTLVEGTWSLPETPEQLNKLKELMSSELIVGPDGTNATEQLYDLIGDDVLFDRISELAAQDPRANLWDDSVVQARMQELGIQMPDNSAHDAMAQPQQAVAEENILRMKTTLSDVKDVDYTEAITQMNKDMLALEAAQSSFSKISQMNLFDYIR
jgi:flagellar hook-associated protein 3 FlgL